LLDEAHGGISDSRRHLLLLNLYEKKGSLCSLSHLDCLSP
jgi:hypothetical protein